METDNEMSRTLRTARILYLAFLVAVLIYAFILFWILPHEVIGAIFPMSDSTLTILTAVLGFLALYTIAYGFFFLPRQMLKAYQKNPKVLLSFNILRCALFEAVAIYGLILGILGAKGQIPLVFFIVSFGALILTFPTEERWKKMKEMLNSYSKPEERG